MVAFRSFLAIVRWDFVLEMRRREAVLNMSLFAVLMLFIAAYGLQQSQGAATEEVGPLFLWISILFAGTVGLSRAFAMERAAGALSGVLVSPLDPGVFYLAKVAATWLYVMAMECLVAVAYVLLFDFNHWERLPSLLATMAAFTLAYVGAGAVIAAMTSSLRGGEVVLRILLFPIMIPVVMMVIKGGDAIFPREPSPAAPGLGITLGRILPLALIYISLGFILFPKVVEE